MNIKAFSEADLSMINETLSAPAKAASRITMPFYHNITAAWNMEDLDPANPNDVPSLNLTIMGLVLSSNVELTVGNHAWTLAEETLSRLGFTDIRHHYFELAERINHPAMVFGRSREKVNGKYVVAAVFRGSSSNEDVISDLDAEPRGFLKAGIHAVTELKAYLNYVGLTKENTTLFITGHSYGASTASLVGILSTDLAERDSIFCYSFATPNYSREGLTGEGMKMFCFASNEDVVPQVPVGPGLDKTGAVVLYDRLDIKLNDARRYERFEKLYRYFRGRDFEEDSDFLPREYSYKLFTKIPINTILIRNHMPYTYMALILSELPDETAYSYIDGSLWQPSEF